MRTTAWAVLFFATVLGCGSNATNPGDAGVDAGPSCSSDQATSDQPCGTLAWNVSGSVSRPRNHHATYVTRAQDGSAFLVAVAGVDKGAEMNDVDVAPIAPDGTLGAFASGPKYGASVGGLVGENVNGVLVGAGGTGAAGVVASVFTSVVQPDGSLAPWQEQKSLDLPRMHASSFAVGSRMWVIGGFDLVVEKGVVFADVAADGTITSWNKAGDLPSPISHASAAYARGFVYLTGGLDQLPTLNPPPRKTVLRGTVEDDGTIDGWTEMTPLPVGIATHGSFIYGGYLYVVGGIDAVPEQLTAVHRAAIQADGTLGPWEDAAPRPLAIAHVHQLPIVGTHVYSVSGAIDFSLDSTNAVFVGSFL